MSKIKEIHIDWKGPHTYDKMKTLSGETDRGVYQFYGHHPVYGSDTLLYIGKAEYCSTFASRMNSCKDYAVWFHKHWTPDAKNMRIYVGRLAGKETPDDAEWKRQIIMVEQLLIFAHSPAWNSKELDLRIKHDNNLKELFDVHIFNWGAHKNLLPEVSGRRYARDYPAEGDFKKYGEAPPAP